jgi:hypothetical protein
MCVRYFAVIALLCFAVSMCAADTFVVPTTTLAAQTGNNTSAVDSFVTQSNGNLGGANVSKINVHTLLYSGATTKIYAHLLLWFGQSNHMNVGYSSSDPQQIHRQITDMISRGIDGVIIDWYGPNNSIDDATKLVMAEAETHPGFTFAIMIDQGAIEWDSCSGCSPQQALISQLQYIEQTYFPSPAYMTLEGRPVITNFNIDLSYSVDWNAVNASLSSHPVFLFQNNSGFTHLLSGGSYSWIMPTTSDYGMSYLTSFYDAGLSLASEETIGATYKGFNDTLAAWGSNRIMGQQCAQTWLKTFSEINGIYNSGTPLPALQIVTWNDYEEGTEIESGINNCLTLTASTASDALNWVVQGDRSTMDHYMVYISTDGQNLMPLGELNAAATTVGLCTYGVPIGDYTLYLQAVGKPGITNTMSAPVEFTSTCQGAIGSPQLSFQASPSSLAMTSGGSATATVTAQVQSGTFNGAIDLACPELPQGLTCSFSPASISLGSAAVSSVLTVSDTSVIVEHNMPRRTGLLVAAIGLVPGIFLVGYIRQRKQIGLVLGTCLLAGMTILGTSCGGKSAPTNVFHGPGIYHVTIRGASGAVQVSTTITVAVR